ncbi:MAG: glycosyltransferase family 52 [Crocinitomicaceae bacterium]
MSVIMGLTTKWPLVIVNSKFQLLCAMELLHKLGAKDCLIFTTMENFDSTIFSKIFNINLREFRIRNIPKLDRELVIIGNDRSFTFETLKAANIFKLIYAVDDGSSDVLQKKHQTPFKRKWYQKICIFALKKISNKYSDSVKFTFNTSGSNNIINDFSYVKNLLSNDPDNSSKKSYFIGQPLTELDLTELSIEVDYIKTSIKNYDLDYYLVHPKDSKEKVNHLQSNGIKCYFGESFETELLLSRIKPSLIVTISSTVAISYILLTKNRNRIIIIDPPLLKKKSMFKDEFIETCTAVYEFINQRNNE